VALVRGGIFPTHFTVKNPIFIQNLAETRHQPYKAEVKVKVEKIIKRISTSASISTYIAEAGRLDHI